MLLAMGDALADTVIARHRRRRRGVRLITIDLDVTEDQTHGAQQLSFFMVSTITGAICRSWARGPVGRFFCFHMRYNALKRGAEQA